MFRILLIVIFLSFSFINFSKANFDVKARTAILQDYYSGEILYEKEPDISIYPASMTKIMTAIIAFDLIKTRRIGLKIFTIVFMCYFPNIAPLLVLDKNLYFYG